MNQILVKVNNHSSSCEYIEMSSALYSPKYCSGPLLLCRPGICCLSAVFPNANSPSRSPANSYLSKPQFQFSQGLCLLLILQALTVFSLCMRAQEKLPTARACSNTRLWCFCVPPTATRAAAPSCSQEFTDFSLCLWHLSVSHLTVAAEMRHLPFQEGCQGTPCWDCTGLLSPWAEWRPISTFKIKLSTLAHI